VKILLISPTLKGIGGIAQHTRDLIKFLKENGHEVDILSSDNIPIIPIKKLKNPSFLFFSFFKSKFMKNYDIVHAQHPIGSLAMKNIAGKKILSIHGIYSEQIGMLHGNKFGMLSNKFEKNALKWADAITAGSEESHKFYEKFSSKINYIPNAIDINSLPTEIDTRYNNQIIFAGRLSKEKGILTILETVKHLPKNIDLIIIGSGPEENLVLNSIKNNKNIHYLGYQPKEKTIPLIRGSKLLIQPSFAEGISATILEAMACKTPVIVSNIGGNKELIINNENGELIQPGNVKELTNKIIEMINDNDKREQISDFAFKSVQKYDWSNIGKLYLNLYKKLLKS
jgi:glycosyltransferase involved in cell wall biosynthesis